MGWVGLGIAYWWILLRQLPIHHSRAAEHEHLGTIEPNLIYQRIFVATRIVRYWYQDQDMNRGKVVIESHYRGLPLPFRPASSPPSATPAFGLPHVQARAECRQML